MKKPFVESNIIYKTILLILLTSTLTMNSFSAYSQQDTISVAFIQGHNEWKEESVSEILDSLSSYFRVDMGMLTGTVGELDAYDVIIVASPQTAFSDAEKYELDQYLMQGGNMLWLLDGCRLSLTELYLKGETPVMSMDLNLNDLFFTYGLRIAPTIVMDGLCDSIDVTIGSGESVVPSRLLWPYSIQLLPSERHPITNGIRKVKGDYLSPIEIVDTAEDLTVTTLLHSSGKGETISLPGMIELSAGNTSFAPDGIRYPIAVMVEGMFPSLFRNRMVPAEVHTTTTTLKKSRPAKIILVSTGSIIKDGNPKDNNRFLLQSIRYLARKDSETSPRMIHSFIVLGIILIGAIVLLIRRRKCSEPLVPGEE